jgi:hypothetical protein
MKKKQSFIRELFSDDNSLNEKAIAGFIALFMMVLALGVDIYTGLQGLPMPINEFIYDGFMYTVLGAFGIASVDKVFGNKNKKPDSSSEETPE